MKSLILFALLMSSYQTSDPTPKPAQGFWSEGSKLKIVSLPKDWSRALVAAVVDFKKEFPDKIDCYAIDVAQYQDQVLIGFSDPSGENSEVQGSNGKCGPDILYKFTLDGKVLSREIVQ